jgi:hypothetical protein
MRRILFVIFAVLILAAIGVYATYARDMKAARARLVSRSQTIKTPFGTLEYAEMGEGEPMLVVHGAEGGFDQGIDMTGAIAGRGYRLIVPSRFGYLRSTMPTNPTTAMQADALPNSSIILASTRWSLSASLPAPGRPCSSRSVIRIAAVRWCFSSRAAQSSGRWSTPISSPGRS